MGAKDEKPTKKRYSDRDEYDQNATTDTTDNALGGSLFSAEDEIDDYFLNPNLEETTRQQEVETIFNSIFGRVGCYNCGLVGLDVKLNPEDIIQFDTQARLIGKKSIIHDS